MKRLMVVFISMVLILATAQAFAKDYLITKKAGDLTVQITMSKNPPITGINKMEIAISDEKGSAVNDAKVSIDYGMPAMPGMGPMNYKNDASLKSNQYLASLNFSMSGPWFINIKINRTGKTQVVKLNVDVK